MNMKRSGAYYLINGTRLTSDCIDRLLFLVELEAAGIKYNRQHVRLIELERRDLLDKDGDHTKLSIKAREIIDEIKSNQ